MRAAKEGRFDRPRHRVLWVAVWTCWRVEEQGSFPDGAAGFRVVCSRHSVTTGVPVGCEMDGSGGEVINTDRREPSGELPQR